MGLFVKKTILFLIIAAVPFAAARQFSLTAGAVYKDGAALVCEAKREIARNGRWKQTPDRTGVLFMGDSKIMAGLIPSVFDAAAGGGVRSHNMALPALPIGPHYFELRDYIASSGPPDWIILSLLLDNSAAPGLFDRYALQGARLNPDILSYAANRKSKNFLLNYLVPTRMYLAPSLKFAAASVFGRDGLRDTRAKNRAAVDRMIRNRGYYYISEQALYPGGRLPDDYGADTPPATPDDYDPRFDPYVKMFIRFACANGINVLLIESPVREREIVPPQTPPRRFTDLAHKWSNVRFARNGWKPKEYPNAMFSDPAHLNPEGAARYTRDIAAEFLEAAGEMKRNRE